jgi:hypothetical protein
MKCQYTGCLCAAKRTGQPRPACSFRSSQTASILEFHVLLTNCFDRRWFCVVRGPKPPLHRHNWLSFWQIPRHRTLFYSLSTPCFVTTAPSGETCKYATVPKTQKNWEILYLLICSPSALPSRLLYRRGRKSRRDLRITLYIKLW